MIHWATANGERIVLVPDHKDRRSPTTTATASQFAEQRFSIESPKRSHLDHHLVVAALALNVRHRSAFNVKGHGRIMPCAFLA